jgi:hypothetical protein
LKQGFIFLSLVISSPKEPKKQNEYIMISMISSNIW